MLYAGPQLTVAIAKKKCYATPYFTQEAPWPADPARRSRGGVSEHPEIVSAFTRVPQKWFPRSATASGRSICGLQRQMCT